jgi:hypothetical protein
MSLLPIRRAPGMVGSSVALGLSALVFPWSSQARACLACRKLMHCDCSTIRKQTISLSSRRSCCGEGKRKGRKEEKSQISFWILLFLFNELGPVHTALPPKWGRGRPVRLACLPSIGPQDPAIRHRRFAADPANRGAGTYVRGQALIRWRWRLGPARFGSYRKPMGV